MEERQTASESSDDLTARRRRGARRTMLFGLAAVGGSLLLVLSPLVLGHGSLNRYLVAFGLIGVCLGLSCLLQGGWDWIKSGRS